MADDNTHPNHRIVSALSEREAIKRYACAISIKDDLFQEEIYGRVSNFSFSSQFWFVTKEEKDALEQNGHIIATEALFKSRVRTFFKKRAWAELYIDFYFSESDEEDGNFPEDMQFFMWENLENWDKVEAIKLSDIERL